MTTILNSLEELGPELEKIPDTFEGIDYTTLLGEWLIRLEDLHSNYFAAEAGPSGTPWPELKKTTTKRQGIDGPNAILVDTGALRASLTEKGSDNAIRDIFGGPDERFHGLVFGTSMEYAIHHQLGQGVPIREHVGVSPEVLDVMADEAAEFVLLEMRAS